ncbi:ABC transporter substrate-binding protein [Rhodovulum strictum]|uniref:ABC transporter substrate-binding protein n=1 Tax=Rhodovulum strictum TaxID=58314 RepID=A0A844B4V8_9RHOB|nr:ABC transporter substrate-binding protein [Rhodovulum strictum]MRH21396.1 ABC transporter substrate-binding protein [Rhodovulum strictum]
MTFLSRTFLAGALAFGVASPAFSDEIVLRYFQNHGGVAAHELAQELGYFEGTGIRLESIGYVSGGPESLFALAGGSVEIGSAATSAILNAIGGGNDFVLAYPTNGINDDAQSIFYVLEDSPIQGIEDLVGKTIAVNTLGAHLDYVVREALHQNGLPQNAANLIVVPGPQLEQVLRSKQVDVAAFGYWQTTFEGAARQNGGIRAIFDDTDIIGDIAGGFAVLRRDWIEANPEAARIFVEASARALDYGRENLEETREIFAEIFKRRGENPEVAQFFAGHGVREGGLPVERDVQFWIDVFEREGNLKPGQIEASNILFVTGDAPVTN